MITFPKDTPQFSWTRHIKNKMVFYHLSGAQILRIFRKPNRREEGIAPNTIAAMASRRPLKNNKQEIINERAKKQRVEEIWIMYRVNKQRTAKDERFKNERMNPETPKFRSRITMISAWRYPGVTKPGERPPIPEDVLEMLEKQY
jgi:hypothetical protein